MVSDADWPEAEGIVAEHFQELAELVKGFAVLGELSPRSVDAISSYGERLSSALVALAFRKFGMETAHVDSREVMITDAPSHAGRTDLLRSLTRVWPRRWRRWPGESGRHGRLHRLDRDRRHDHAGPRRLRFQRVDGGRGHRRRGDSDLDRRGRHADGRSHDSAGRSSREDHLVRRGRRAGLFRRQGAAPGHRAAGHREEHPGADSELAAAGGARARESSPRRLPAPTSSSRSPASARSPWSTSTRRAC